MPEQRERIHFHRFPETRDVTAVLARDVRGEFPRHVHGSCIVGLMDRGGRVITLTGPESRDVQVPEKGLFVLDAGRPHQCKPLGGHVQSYRVLGVSPLRLAKLAQDISGKPEPTPCFPQVLVNDPDLARRMRRLFGLLFRPEDPLTLEVALNRLLSRLILGHGQTRPRERTPARPHRAVERARQHILADPAGHDRDLTLAGLSRAAGVSPYHLHKLFVAQVGVTPQEFVMNERVRLARGLLDQGLEPGQAALESGFCDQSHLNRCFRKLVGTTPGRYARGKPGQAY